MHFTDAKSILSATNGMNLYRGCTHGCIYCDSRSVCYQMRHAFEDIEVKQNAPALLTKALAGKRTRCMIGTGSMCDPYLPIEEDLQLTRRCLSIILQYGFGATVLTKSCRVLRDLALLCEINARARSVVQMTLTTFDEPLCRILEPNVSTTQERYQALKQFQAAGVPTVVWLTPILPFLNDTEENLRGLLSYCFDAGVRGIVCFGIGTTMRDGSRDYFYQALDAHFPGIKQRYMRRYGSDYNCPSDNSDRLMRILAEECEAHGVLWRVRDTFAYLNAFPQTDSATQLRLFEP